MITIPQYPIEKHTEVSWPMIAALAVEIIIAVVAVIVL